MELNLTPPSFFFLKYTLGGFLFSRKPTVSNSLSRMARWLFTCSFPPSSTIRTRSDERATAMTSRPRPFPWAAPSMIPEEPLLCGRRKERRGGGREAMSGNCSPSCFRCMRRQIMHDPAPPSLPPSLPPCLLTRQIEQLNLGVVVNNVPWNACQGRKFVRGSLRLWNGKGGRKGGEKK